MCWSPIVKIWTHPKNEPTLISYSARLTNACMRDSTYTSRSFDFATLSLFFPGFLVANADFRKLKTPLAFPIKNPETGFGGGWVAEEVDFDLETLEFSKITKIPTYNGRASKGKSSWLLWPTGNHQKRRTQIKRL